MRCSSCGAEISDNAAFCGYCGARNIPAASTNANKPGESVFSGEKPAYNTGYTTAAEQNNVPAENKSKQRFGMGTFVFFLIVTFILAVGMGIFAGLYFNLIKVL